VNVDNHFAARLVNALFIDVAVGEAGKTLGRGKRR
jgi:hypothetical protein